MIINDSCVATIQNFNADYCKFYNACSYQYTTLLPSVLVVANLLTNFFVSFSFCNACSRAVLLPHQHLTLFVICLNLLLLRPKACPSKVLLLMVIPEYTNIHKHATHMHMYAYICDLI